MKNRIYVCTIRIRVNCIITLIYVTITHSHAIKAACIDLMTDGLDSRDSEPSFLKR